MRKKTLMLTIADALFTIFCLITVGVWYMHVPYAAAVTVVLAILAAGVLLYSKKGIDAESEFLNEYSQLLENEKYFRSAFDYAGSGMALLSRHGRYLKVNYVLSQILGYSEEELLSMSIRKLLYREDFRNDLKKIKEMMHGEIKAYQSMQRFINKKGETIWVLTTFSFKRDENNKPVYFVVQFQHESVISSYDSGLQNMGYHDELTGLFTRNFLEQHLKELLTSAKENKKMFALLMLDLDALKNVNESVGHEMGDVVLKMVAERLKGLVRSEDVVARVGGDEFAIVINNANSIETIAQVAQKILGGLLKASMLNGREVYVTASMGISVYPGDGEDAETLIKNAEAASVKAKANGGNNYQFGTADLTEKAQERSKQQSALNQAMAKNELLLYYQPCLNVSDQSITCVEALIRWQNKEYGLVMPDTLIPMAEESGLIVPISEWILRTACKQVKHWQKDNPSLKLAINLSAYQFKNLNFMNNIIRALRETEFSPQSLVLEVTEGLIMHDHENTISILTTIKEEGISVVVDDFGTGFSSFSYLSNYAVDKIKIDQSFVQQMTKGPNEAAIVSAMISMADKLGMKAVAKGVETKEQYDLLVSEGCNEMQGYFIAKPLPVEIMESFLKSRAVVPTENDEPRQG